MRLKRFLATAAPHPPAVDFRVGYATGLSAISALAPFTGRKLRQHPRGAGSCRLDETVWHESLAQAAVRLLKALRYWGVNQVEFKRDPRDGRFCLMAVDARHWPWHSLAAASGVNLSFAAYADAIGPHLLAEERPLRLVDLPLAIMDTTLHQSHDRGLQAPEVEAAARAVLERVRAAGGAVALRWHNVRFDPHSAEGYDDVYWRLVDWVREAGGTAGAAGAIVDRWRRALGEEVFSGGGRGEAT